MGNASAAALDSAAEVRTIRPAEVSAAAPVQLEGVITFRDPASGLTYLQDESGGIEIRGIPVGVGPEVGSRVRISGRCDGDRGIPGLRVDPGGLEVIGRGPLPEAAEFDADAAKSGGLDGRRVRLEGVVIVAKASEERDDARWWNIGLRTRMGFFTTLLPRHSLEQPPEDLRFSRVEVTGVGEAILNNRGQRVGVLFFLSSVENIRVIIPPLADPFDRPTRKISELMRPGLDDPLERIRVEGTVLHQSEGMDKAAFVRTDEGALQAFLTEGALEPGDRVALVGHPDLLDKNVVLQDALAMQLEKRGAPAPLDREVDELLRHGGDSDLVRIQGKVLRNALETPQGSLFLESGERVVEVVLDGPVGREVRGELAERLNAGTRLAVTGICELRGAMRVTGAVDLTDIRIVARAPADLVVLRPAPWWTTGRLLTLAAGLAALALLSVAWVMGLRRRVRTQTEIIRDKIERETRWIERSRIARDIHDDVGSALTQISLLGDLGRRDLVVEPPIERQFERISGQAREAVRALDEIVWTVNPRNDTLAGTVAYLNQMIEDMAEDSGLRCRFDIPEEIPELPLNARTRHNLLLACKEAAHNAVKHAGTSLLMVSMCWEGELLIVEVADDGSGFYPEKTAPGRTGLDSMRRRMEEAGGEVTIVSCPGQPTCVTFKLPLEMSGSADLPGMAST